MARLEQRRAEREPGAMKDRSSGDAPPGGKAWLWMALCCIPMIAIVVLVALGVWNLW